MKSAGSNRTIFQTAKAGRNRMSRAERLNARAEADARWNEMDKAQEKHFQEMLLPSAVPRPRFAEIVDALPLLDDLLAKHSLRDVLGTLAQLCEARAPSEFDLETDFSDHETDELWNERAAALYKLAGVVK